jgi:uncharacterized repeat protein (TIGR01451 family)
MNAVTPLFPSRPISTPDRRRFMGIEPLEARIAPALVLAISDGADAITPASTLTYTIDFANTGEDDAAGVVLENDLPAGTSFAADENPGWVFDGGKLRFAVGDVAAGAGGQAELKLRVAAVAPAGLATIASTAAIFRAGADEPAAQAGDTTALVAAPDLTVTKTHDAVGAVAPGSEIGYTITFANVGNQDSTGVVLTEHLPAGTHFDTAGSSSGWTETVAGSGVYQFVVGSLAGGGGGGSVIFAVRLSDTAAAGHEEVVNVVTIADDGANGEDPTPNNNASTVSIALDAAPDLILTKSDGRDAVRRGQAVTYSLTYANAGTQDASGVAITDLLPAGTLFDAAANPGWVFDAQSGTLTFAVGALAAGAQGTVALVLTVAADLPGDAVSITNTASIGDDGTGGPDMNPENNTATDIDAIIRAVDLTLGKTSESTVVLPGGALTYNFSYANVGDLDATGVVLTDTLPAGASFDAAANPGWVLDGTTLTFLVGDVAAGGQGSAALKLGIVSVAPAGVEQIVNLATIADDGTHGADFTPGDNSASFSVALDAAPDLTLTKIGNGLNVFPGGTVTYNFTYANVGNQHAAGVVITDVLPAGTVFDAALNPGWTLAGGTLSFAHGALEVGGGGTATLVLKVAPSVPAGLTEIVNTASIADDGSSGADANPNDNTATASNPLTASFDLRLTINPGATSALPGGTLAFTLNYSNTGNQGASGVVLTENLPAGTTFNAAASTAGWVQVSPGVFQLNVGAVAGGATGSAVFAVNVTSPAAAGREQVVNFVTLAGDGTDPTPVNNSAQASVALNAAPNLGVSQVATATSLVAGGTVTYVITYSNFGNQNATGVKLTEVLPPGFSFLSAGSSAGWVSAGARTFEYNVGELAVGQSVTVSFQARAATNLAPGSQPENRVSIADDGTSGPDSNLANNISGLALGVAGPAKPPVALIPDPEIVTKVKNGSVKVYDANTGLLKFKIRPYGDDVKRVRVAAGDINGDGVADIITASSKGSGSVRAYDGKTGQRMFIGGLAELNPFKDSGGHGASVAVADINRDGIADIIVGEGRGGGRVKVYDGRTGGLLSEFKAFESEADGVRLGVSDVNGDGIVDLLANPASAASQTVGSNPTRAFSFANLDSLYTPERIL